MNEYSRIRWAPSLRRLLLKSLYESDTSGFQDMALCDEVGIALYARCKTFALVSRNEVECPVCRTIFPVLAIGISLCPGNCCDWQTTHPEYIQSIRNYNAHTGRALDAFLTYYDRYPKASTYKEKILIIDQLIHSFHINEKTGLAVKSVASKLLEGNKKAVVRFLDDLSAIHPEEKAKWRRSISVTIDRRVLRENTSNEV